MSSQVSGAKGIPNYTQKDLQAQTKHNPYVDNYNHYTTGAQGKKIKPTIAKRELPPFFEKLIDQKVHQVAIMVIFHIIHFFCHMFWDDYRVEFDRREEIENKKQEKLDALKKDKADLDKKVEKLLRKKTSPTSASPASVTVPPPAHT